MAEAEGDLLQELGVTARAADVLERELLAEVGQAHDEEAHGEEHARMLVQPVMFGDTAACCCHAPAQPGNHIHHLGNGH